MSEQERILVCVSASPTNADVIRRAAALSDAMGAELIAVYVEDVELRDEAQARAVHDHLSLAERHGALLTTIYGNDPATAIAEYARVSGITKIVLGKSPGRRTRDTLMARLNELAPNLEIIIIPNRLTANTNPSRLFQFLGRERFSFEDLAKTALILAACTGMGFLFSSIGLAITNVVLIYILGVMGVALTTTGYLYSLLSSLLSVLVFNFFFTEPFYSLRSSPDYLATFAVMFTAALLSSSLTSRIKAQSIQTANKAYQTEVLLSTSQLLQKAEDRQAILEVVQRQLSRLLEHSVLCYDSDLDAPALCAIEQDGGFEGIDLAGERHVARWVRENAKHAGRTTHMFPEARCLYMAVRSEGRVWAVIGIRADNSPPIDEYRKNLMISILDECALAVEKDHMTREKQRMEENARQESLRANLLRSISHDLRTPLTSISGNAAILMENQGQLSEASLKRLYTSIYDDAIWLNGLVENLLTITRTENGTMKLNLQTELGRRPQANRDGPAGGDAAGADGRGADRAGACEPFEQCGEVHAGGREDRRRRSTGRRHGADPGGGRRSGCAARRRGPGVRHVLHRREALPGQPSGHRAGAGAVQEHRAGPRGRDRRGKHPAPRREILVYPSNRGGRRL